MSEKATRMVCDDRAEFKYRNEPPVEVTEEQQAKLDAIASEFLSSRKAKNAQAA